MDLHAIVDEVDLPAALQFLLRWPTCISFSSHVRDHRLDRQAVFRRRLDHGHVAQAHQRHVQRARNRRRRHRQHVHFFLQLLQPLLVPHAEALLFVDDHQAEIRET